MLCNAKLGLRYGHMKGPFHVIARLLPGSLKPNATRNPHYQIIRRPGAVSREKNVPEFISRPDYATSSAMQQQEERPKNKIIINNEETVRKMRQSCALAKHILHIAGSLVEPGITTDEIDAAVHKEIIRCGAYPSTLRYKGFPKSCCTSVNNVVCHGIPDNTTLQTGSIINIDITVFYLGCHGDTSDTFKVGEVDAAASKLISVTRNALQSGISVCKPGAKFSDISQAIEPFAKSQGFNICRRFVGHGIGESFHSAPNIWHTSTILADRRKMEPGMAFTIEPILMEGGDAVRILKDGWTAVSKDDLRSAQAEHTVLITQSGHEILTL